MYGFKPLVTADALRAALERDGFRVTEHPTLEPDGATSPASVAEIERRLASTSPAAIELEGSELPYHARAIGAVVASALASSGADAARFAAEVGTASRRWSNDALDAFLLIVAYASRRTSTRSCEGWSSSGSPSGTRSTHAP